MTIWIFLCSNWVLDLNWNVWIQMTIWILLIMIMYAYLNKNDNLNLIKKDNVCIIEIRYEWFFVGTFLYYYIWIHDFSYCMYTFYSSIIKCNYLYFVVYIITIIYGAIGVERVRVGRVAKLCVTHSGMMHLTWTYEMRGSQIVQHILDSLRMATVACYLVSFLCVFYLWFRQRSPVVLRHTNIG
jgi:hypothetical protein